LAKHNNGGLQICFQSNTSGPCQKGEIKFPDKSWKFSYMRTESIDAISLRTGSDYVATIGSTEANFKVDANFDQSTQNIHSKWEHKKELDAQNTTKMIEQKAVRGAKGRKQVPLIQPGGRYKQIMNNANRAQSVKQEVKQPPKNASTPPMPSAKTSQYGKLEKRVLHIMVLERSGLTTQKIKEKLSVRKLITPLEMREFEGAAARVGTMSAAGRKWNANKEQLSNVSPNWPGYSDREKAQVADILRELSTESDPPERKRPAPEQNESDKKRTRVPSPVRQNQDSRDSQPPTMETTPRDSPSVSSSASSQASPMSSSAQSSSANSTSSTLTPAKESSPWQKSPKTPPPQQQQKRKEGQPLKQSKHEEKTASGSNNTVMQEYARKKKMAEQKNIEEKQRRQEADRHRRDEAERERADRRLSHEQIQRNDQDQKSFESQVEHDLVKKYPTVRSQSQADKYEKEFNRNYHKYEEMRPRIEDVCARFDKLETELRRCESGSTDFKKVYTKSIQEYKAQCDRGFFTDKKKYIEVFLKLRHIKSKLKDWREEHQEPESSY